MTTARQISIRVNGKPVDLVVADGEAPTLGPTLGPTVAQWLDDLGRDPRTVAIELNGDILPRARYGETRLEDGDKLEVVQFVQGG